MTEQGFLIRPRVIWAVVVAALVLAAIPWVRHLVLPSVVREPEPFTAIAFADPARPIDCRAGSAVIAVTNHEGRPRTYRYTTSVLRAGRPAAISHGQVTVGDGVTSSASIRLGSDTTAKPYTVAVALDDDGEQVQATCSPGAS